jgi:hypothetical protein
VYFSSDLNGPAALPIFTNHGVLRSAIFLSQPELTMADYTFEAAVLALSLLDGICGCPSRLRVFRARF